MAEQSLEGADVKIMDRFLCEGKRHNGYYRKIFRYNWFWCESNEG